MKKRITVDTEFSAEYLGKTGKTGKKDKNFPDAFRWSVALRGERFDYLMGWGHVDKFGRPKPPKIEDVMYSLLADSYAASGTFAEFCSEYGYDTDSRKALDTYTACQENSARLRKVFTGAELVQIATELEEY